MYACLTVATMFFVPSGLTVSKLLYIYMLLPILFSSILPFFCYIIVMMLVKRNTEPLDSQFRLRECTISAVQAPNRAIG